MGMLQDEIPFTTDGLYAYIRECNKELKKLKPIINKFNRLKKRVKLAQERLNKRYA